MSNEVVIEYDRKPEEGDGVVVSLDRIAPATLRRLVEEFVTREWSELADEGFTLDEKVEQVLQQLKDRKALVVFDVVSETCNIVLSDNMNRSLKP